mgnify:CR=1 FL=1
MTPRKLSDTDKQDILELYRQPGETTSTLASRYGVSNSTISRLLKSGLAEAEYEALIQQKRANRSVSDVDSEESEDVAETTPEQLEMPLPEPEPVHSEGRRSRRRSSAPTTSAPIEAVLDHPVTSEVALIEPVLEDVPESTLAGYPVEESALEEILAEELLESEELAELDDEEDDLDDDLDEDDLDEDDDDLDDDLEGTGLLVVSKIQGTALVQVLPLAEASLPRTCYLVVDRSAELIARPLKEFGDLGQIPEAETQEKTLPVFDNHRVAKRYSNPRTQRVIKLPDGKVLQKTSSHLQAKGITRLLIDGQVYSL